MSLIDGIRHRIHVLFRREAYMREVERELRFHVELETLATSADIDKVADAEFSARRRLGNAAYYCEETRHMTPLRWLDRVHQDATYAVRGLRRSPGFTVAVVMTLGLGLGVNAAMYSFLDAVFAQPPAGVVDPGGVRRLYIDVGYAVARSGSPVFAKFNYPNFDLVRAAAEKPDRVAAFTSRDSVRLQVETRSIPAGVSYVTPTYFRLLSLHPALGRFFAPDEESMEISSPVIVLSDALWHRAFAANPRVLGTQISVDGQRATVVGIAPPDFSGIDLNSVDLWLPLNMFPEPPRAGIPWYRSDGNYLSAIARIDPRHSVDSYVRRGSAALRAVIVRKSDSASTLMTGPIVEARGPADRDQSVAISTRLAGVALIVLVIACANVANLLLLRASSRRRELAVRRALGVSLLRLYEQLLTESLMLSAISGAVALMLAQWGGSALRTLLLPRIHWASAPLNPHIMVVIVGVALLIGGVTSVFPALGAMSPDLVDGLKAGSRGQSYRTSRTQSALLIAQAALSMVLLVGSGLFVRSLNNVQSIDIGYDPHGVLLVGGFVRDPEKARELGQTLTQLSIRLRGSPGVTAVGLSGTTPMAGLMYSRWYLPGHDSLLKTPGEYVSDIIASPEFFQASGLHILSGRGFDDRDRLGSESVAVVGKHMAALVWPGDNPLGKCIVLYKPTNGCTRVIGVTDDVHRMQIMEAAGAQFYLPLAQQTDYPPTVMIVRARASQLAAVSSLIRADLARASGNPDDYRVQSMTQILEPELRPWKLGAILFSAFGFLALFVTGVGIYSVVAYGVSQRTHEMGIRTAIGAQRHDILDLLVREGLRVVGIGVALGTVVALGMGRLVSSLLFGVTASDTSTLIGSVAVLCLLAMIACLVPGWRAAKIDPVVALRTE